KLIGTGFEELFTGTAKMSLVPPEGPQVEIFPIRDLAAPGWESFPLFEPEPNILTTPVQDLSQLLSNVEKFPVGEPLPPLFLPGPRAVYRDPGLLTFIRHFVRPVVRASAGSSGRCSSCGPTPTHVHHGIEDRRTYDTATYNAANWQDNSVPSYSS